MFLTLTFLLMLTTICGAQILQGFNMSLIGNLGVVYSGGKNIKPGQVLTSQDIVYPPYLGAYATLDGTYVVALVDLDVNGGRDSTVDWLQSNFQSQTDQASKGWVPLTSSTIATVPYLAPQRLPSDPGYNHSLLFLLYAQPQGYTIPKGYQNFNNMTRNQFNVTSFALAANLGHPLAVNYFLLSFNEASEGMTSATSGYGTSTAISSTTVPTNTDGQSPTTTSQAVLATGSSSIPSPFKGNGAILETSSKLEIFALTIIVWGIL